MSAQGAAGVSLLVNGEACVVPATTTVEGLLALFGVDRRGVAVALDGEVVPRSSWSHAQLADGSRVEIVGAAAGG